MYATKNDLKKVYGELSVPNTLYSKWETDTKLIFRLASTPCINAYIKEIEINFFINENGKKQMKDMIVYDSKNAVAKSISNCDVERIINSLSFDITINNFGFIFLYNKEEIIVTLDFSNRYQLISTSELKEVGKFAGELDKIVNNILLFKEPNYESLYSIPFSTYIDFSYNASGPILILDKEFDKDGNLISNDVLDNFLHN